MIGWSAGFTFWYEGGTIPVGSCRSVLEIAAWMSWAAASMLRSRVNWSVMLVLPRLDEEVIWSTPAIVENCFSSGVATARSEEHTSELQSQSNLVCRLLLE